MIKKFFLSLALAAGLLSPAHSAGTIPYSLSQQFDSLGKPLNGCKLYIFSAGTTTPQSAYSDTDLTLPLPNPLTCDSAGRLPQFFLADGSVKIRLTDAAGVNQGYGGAGTIDGILVVGASSGGGGGSPVDATTILSTGDVKYKYGTGNLVGFVRANGRTVGSASSGATERANADCQELFEYLWATDANLAVSTGRGASANADWVANKTITLPDGRGLALAGLDDMGNSSRGAFTGVTFSIGNATTLGSVLGAARRTLTLAQLPTGIQSQNNSFNISVTSNTSAIQVTASNSAIASGGAATVPNSNASAVVSNGTVAAGNVTSTSTNTSGSAFDSISPYLLITTYIKL